MARLDTRGGRGEDGAVVSPSVEALPAAVLRPVREHHAFESCVERLGSAIRLGVYPRGTTLPPERDLAAMLGVSRATLREAIAVLREAGLIETRRGRGGGNVVIQRPRTPSARAAARMTDEERADWRDVLEFRRIVEPGAAALAAEIDLDDARREQLRAAHAAVVDAPRAALHRQADARLHLTIAALTGSQRVVDAVTSVQTTVNEMLLAVPAAAASVAHSHEQHALVVTAILDGHPAAARRAMQQHCDDTAALLRGLIG